MACGIYQILNTLNQNAYIGQSEDTDLRWYTHRGFLNLGKHPNKHLQAAWKKYGEDAFEWSVVEEVKPKQLTKREQFWMDKLRSEGTTLYNMQPAAGSCKGIKRSAETRAKMTASQKARHNEESKARMSEQSKARWADPVWREKQLERCRAGREKKAAERLKRFRTNRRLKAKEARN